MTIINFTVSNFTLRDKRECWKVLSLAHISKSDKISKFSSGNDFLVNPRTVQHLLIRAAGMSKEKSNYVLHPEWTKRKISSPIFLSHFGDFYA